MPQETSSTFRCPGHRPLGLNDAVEFLALPADDVAPIRKYQVVQRREVVVEVHRLTSGCVGHRNFANGRPGEVRSWPRTPVRCRSWKLTFGAIRRVGQRLLFAILSNRQSRPLPGVQCECHSTPLPTRSCHCMFSRLSAVDARRYAVIDDPAGAGAAVLTPFQSSTPTVPWVPSSNALTTTSPSARFAGFRREWPRKQSSTNWWD